MSNEIKDCPFCGQNAGMVETHDGAFFVECSYCFAKSSVWGTEEDATKYWNGREETPTSEIADALNNIAESLKDFYGNVTVNKHWSDMDDE